VKFIFDDCEPISRDNISLAEAFETLRRWRALSPIEPSSSSPDRKAWVEKWNRIIGDLMKVLISGELAAHVFDPKLKMEFRITRPEWAGVRNPESVFVLKRIDEVVNPSLRNHHERTPYVNEGEFHRLFGKDWLWNKPQYSDKEMKDWFLEQVASLGERKPPSEKSQWKDFQTRFPGVKREVFRDLRNANTPENWRKQGPRQAQQKLGAALLDRTDS
jgi:hypothetical protein